MHDRKRHTHGSCRATPMGVTSLTRRPAPQQEEPRFARSDALCAYYRLELQPTRLPPPSHGQQIRTCVRYFSSRLLLYFAAVQAPGALGSGFRIMVLNWGGAMGIRTPDLLHAMQWQHVHGSASVQVTVSGRPHQSAGIQAGCCTFVLYRPEPPPAVQAEGISFREARTTHSSRLYRSSPTRSP